MAKEKLVSEFGLFYISVIAIQVVIYSAISLIGRDNISMRTRRFLLSCGLTILETRTFLVFLLATISVGIIFPFYLRIVYISLYFPFFVFVMTVGGGIFLSLLLSIIFKPIYNSLRIIAITVMILFLGQLVITNYVHLTKYHPISSLPGHQVLHKYKGHSFVSNYHSSYINYFTDEWTKMNVGPVYDIDRYIEETDVSVFLFVRDKLVDPEKYERPEYLFLWHTVIGSNVDYNDTLKFTKKFPVVEEGDGFMIIDLRERITGE